MCCGTKASVSALRNLTASCKNIHAVAMVSTYAMTSHRTSVRSCHLTDAKALRNTYVGKDLPAHVMNGNGRVEVQLLLFVTSVPNGMYSVCSYDLRTIQRYSHAASRLKNRHDKCRVSVHFLLEGTGLRFPAGQEIMLSSKTPYRLWGSLSLLFSQ